MTFLVKNKDRESNFELLRIAAMFLIVLSHCNAHGIFNYWQDNSTLLSHINNFICFIFGSGGKIGVTLFILLMGYFSCQQRFKLKKWLNIYLETLFFSVFFFCCWFLIDPEQARHAKSDSFFPLTRNAYWFVTSYLLLYIFSPLLNIILEKAQPKMIRTYLVIGLILFILCPLFKLDFAYSLLFYLMYLYVLGGAIRLKYVDFSKKSLLLFLVLGVGIAAGKAGVSLFTKTKPVNLWKYFGYIEINTFYCLSVSLAIFYGFKSLKIKSPCINWMAASMFGVYLIHENNLVRPYLWHEMLNMDTYMTSPWFVVWPVIVSLSVFGLCVVADKLLSFVYNPIIGYVENRLSKIKQLQKYL